MRPLPGLDAVTAYEAGLSTARDPELLEWAALSGRVVVTHDRRTMPGHAAARLAAGARTPGLLVAPRSLSLGRAIDDLELIVTCGLEDELDGAVRFLPL